MTKAIILDFDGTLADTASVIIQTIKGGILNLGVRVLEKLLCLLLGLRHYGLTLLLELLHFLFVAGNGFLQLLFA